MRVLFIGTHGQENIGDELLLKIFHSKLNSKVDQWYINSYKPSQTAAYVNSNDTQVFHTRKDTLKLFQYLVRCELVLFGGGSILKELYTEYGGSRYGTLKIINHITYLANLFNKPIIMSHIGVGPLESEKSKLITKRIVNRASFISVRDSDSFSKLNNIMNPLLVMNAADAVFSLDSSFFLTVPVKKKQKKIVGINICRNIKNNKNWKYFIGKFADDLITLYKEKNVELIGIPMQQRTKTNNDYEALRSLNRALKRRGSKQQITIKKTVGIMDVAELLSSCSVFVGARLHSLIVASVLNVPYVVIEYDPKVSAFSIDMRVQSYAIKINSKFTSGEIYTKVKYLLESPENFKRTTRNRANNMKKLSSQAFSKLIGYIDFLENNT